MNFEVVYWVIVMILVFAFLHLWRRVYLDDQRRIRMIRKIRPGTPVWVMFGGEPVRMILKGHSKDGIICQWEGAVLDIEHEQVIIDIN